MLKRHLAVAGVSLAMAVWASMASARPLDRCTSFVRPNGVFGKAWSGLLVIVVGPHFGEGLKSWGIG